MNRAFFFSFSIVIGFMVIFSCVEDDPCQNKQCVNGYCLEGICECFPGFEGIECQSKSKVDGSNEALFGDWKREDGLAWIRATSSEVLICAPEVTSEPQRCDWKGTGLLSCNLLGSIGDWGLELVGSQLKLIPITNAATNDPAYYNRDNDFYCDDTGKAKLTFFTKSGLGCGKISVTILEVSTKEISSYFSQGIEACETSGCANFVLRPGTYTYEANCTDISWSQTVTISEGCTLYELK